MEKLPNKAGATTKFRYICDVKKIENRYKKCIEVDNEDHMYLAGKSLIPTHNSFLARYAAIIYALNVPGIQIYIFRRTFAEVRGNFLFGPDGLQATLQNAEKAGLCNINLAENRIHFHNGADIYLRHMQNPQDVEQIRGRDVHVLIADEATQWLTRDIYNQLRTCMRCSLDIDYKGLEKIGMSFIKPGYFPRALLLSNPGGVAHGFIKAEFIDILEPGVPKQMSEEKGGMLREFIPARLEDNVHLMKTDPNYRAKLLGSGKHVRAMLEGDWSIPDGSAFADEWSHTYNEMCSFSIPKHARIKRCFDWGIAKPYAVTYCWETQNDTITLPNGDEITFAPGTIIVLDELYGWNGNPDEGNRKTAYQVGRHIKEFEVNRPWFHQIEPGPSDSSIWNGTGTDKTINDDVVDGYNAYWDEALPHSKVSRSALFMKADKSKGSRAKGLALVKSYLAGAHPLETGEQSDQPGLIFCESAKHCIRTLPIIPYDLLNPDDVDTKAEDHLYDTIRYAVLGRTRVFESLEIDGF